MNWPSFYAPSAAWLALLIVPLVVFYFLKLKRPQLKIPSLVLWQQVINDQRVNSPFQKFKRNFLLLLQLLLLACLILAVMQPFVSSGTDRLKYLPVLIDCSASMQAVAPGKPSRLEQAKQRVVTIIDNLLPDQQMSLIAVGSTAQRLTGFTDNKRLLKEGLAKLEATDLPSQIEEGLRMAQALAQTLPIETVLLYTDGNVPTQVDFDLPFQLQFHRLGEPTANIGITSLTAQRSDLGKWHVFIEVTASEAGSGEAQLQLLSDNQLIAEDSISLETNSTSLEIGRAERFQYQVTAESAARLDVRLKPEGHDALRADNQATLQLPEGRPLVVYCAPSLPAFRHALQALSGVKVYPEEESIDVPQEFDLSITDDQDPGPGESRVRLTVGSIPSAIQDILTVETGSSYVVDWQRNSLLLQHVQLTDVLMTDQTRTTQGKGDGDYESLGYQILAHGNTGPLILKQHNENCLNYHLLFHTDRSTLGFRVAFPIMVANVVGITLRESALSERRARKTGVLPGLHLEGETSYQIVGPRSTRQVTTGADGLLSGVAAPYAGVYKILQEGVEVGQVAANLLSAQETSLAGADALQLREIAVAVQEEKVLNDRPLWHSFAWAAFFLLLVEWWYFNRPLQVGVS